MKVLLHTLACLIFVLGDLLLNALTLLLELLALVHEQLEMQILGIGCFLCNERTHFLFVPQIATACKNSDQVRVL